MLSGLSFEEHGGIDPAELHKYSVSPDQLIDFSVNSNPFGPSPCVMEMINKINVSRYPDRFCGEISEKLALLNNIPLDQILVGNGTAELIWLIAQAYIKHGDEVLIIGPTFGEYQRAAKRYWGIHYKDRCPATRFYSSCERGDRCHSKPVPSTRIPV